MARIEWQDTAEDIIMKMSDMNPGAISVLVNILQKTERIDPDNAMGGLGVIMMLDNNGIYGDDIFVLYCDICNSDTAKMIAVLRAVQLGFFSGNTLRDAASRQDRSGRKMVPVDELCSKVKEELPDFCLTASMEPAPGAADQPQQPAP